MSRPGTHRRFLIQERQLSCPAVNCIGAYPTSGFSVELVYFVGCVEKSSCRVGDQKRRVRRFGCQAQGRGLSAGRIEAIRVNALAAFAGVSTHKYQVPRIGGKYIRCPCKGQQKKQLKNLSAQDRTAPELSHSCAPCGEITTTKPSLGSPTEQND